MCGVELNSLCGLSFFDCRCTGFIFQKVGKLAATAVGGGFFLLQVRMGSLGFVKTVPGGSSELHREVGWSSGWALAWVSGDLGSTPCSARDSPCDLVQVTSDESVLQSKVCLSTTGKSSGDMVAGTARAKTCTTAPPALL